MEKKHVLKTKVSENTNRFDQWRNVKFLSGEKVTQLPRNSRHFPQNIGS